VLAIRLQYQVRHVVFQGDYCIDVSYYQISAMVSCLEPILKRIKNQKLGQCWTTTLSSTVPFESILQAMLCVTYLPKFSIQHMG
jgi:hypothetical protein